MRATSILAVHWTMSTITFSHLLVKSFDSKAAEIILLTINSWWRFFPLVLLIGFSLGGSWMFLVKNLGQYSLLANWTSSASIDLS